MKYKLDTYYFSTNLQLLLGYIFMVIDTQNHLFPGGTLMSSYVALEWWF